MGARSTARIVGAQLRLSCLEALAYRVGFWSDGVVGVLWGAIGVIPLLVAIEHRPDVAGWSAWELMLLSGLFMVVSGIFSSFLQPALRASMEHIRRGSLDYLLLRPVSPLVLCLVADFAPWSALEIVAGISLCVVSLVKLGVSPSAAELGLAAAVFAAGIIALYALGIIALSLSFRALRLQNLTNLMETLLDFARWPTSAFSGPLKAFFTFVIPFAVMTTRPAEGLLGRLDGGSAMAAGTTSLVLMSLAWILWRRSLRLYTSASS